MTTLTVINGGGTGARPVRRYEALVQATRAIERYVAAGWIFAARFTARNLTAIERGAVATRMHRDGHKDEQVLEVLR